MNQRLRTVARRAWRLLREHVGLLVVLGIALAFRLAYLRWFKVLPPGDVFNFINIALGIPDGTYPPNERRLPFYPLLILLFSFLGWERAALVVAVAASLGALVALYALGRTLGFSKTSLAALLLVFQAHPQVLIATRGYADTTLFALLPATLLALFRARTWKGAVLTGVLCGALALTRYEGLTAALVLLPLWFLSPGRLLPRRPSTTLGTGQTSEEDTHRAQRDRAAGIPRGSRRYALIGMLAFALSLVPYLLLSAANDRPVFGAGYIAEAAGRSGYGAGNLREFTDSALSIWKRTALFGAWEIPLAIAREIRADPLATTRILTARLVEVGEPVALLVLLGVTALLLRQRRPLLFLLASTAATTVPPAWFNPIPRHDISVLPFTILFAASGITVIQKLVERGTRSSGTAGRAVRWLAGIAFLLIAAGLWTIKYAEDVRNRQTKHNGRDYAYYQAIHAARSLPGKIAFDRDPDIVRLYFGSRAVVLRPILAEGEPPAGALARLREHGVSALVVPSGEILERLRPLLTLPEVTLRQPFEWPRGTGEVSRAAIYRIE